MKIVYAIKCNRIWVRDMVSQPIWIGITIAVFFVGIGISYAIFSSTDDPSTMKFANQDMFDQMMSQNPKMSQQWMDSMMQDPQFMQTMTQNDEFMHEMMELMSGEGVMGGPMMGSSPIEEHEGMLEMMEYIMEEEQLRDHMLAHMIENQELVHRMFTLMDSNPELKKHMEAHVSGDISGFETT